MKTNRNLPNQLNLKFSDHDDLLGYQDYNRYFENETNAFSDTTSNSRTNDTIYIDYHSQSKEKMIQSQKEAALRRIRYQFRTGIVTDVVHHSNQRIPPTTSGAAKDDKYFTSSALKDHEYNESKHRELTSRESPNQFRVNNRTDLELNIHEGQAFKVSEDESSRFDIPPVFRHSSLTHDKHLCMTELEEESKDGTLQYPVSDRNKKDSIDIKEELIWIKEMNSSEKDRIGLLRSPSTLSHIITGDMNNKSKATFFPYDTPEDIDTEEETSSNVLSHTKSDTFENVNWENTDEVKKILMEPVPKEYGMVKCYVKRYRGKSRLCPEYRVYLDGSNQFLMTSKKRANKKSSNYLISMKRNDYSKSSSNIIGKLRANFLGTEFQIYDSGKNPKHLDSYFDEKNYDEPRCELGVILYSSNIIGNRGPRKMQVCINRVSEHGECVKRWQPAIKDEEMLECFKTKNETARKHLLFYENRQPKWNEDIGSYVLNFDKRVSLASVKNFQLIDPTSSNGKVLMQFGKKGKDEFIMDVQYPMSLFQAFAVSLSSCDSKLGVD